MMFIKSKDQALLKSIMGVMTESAQQTEEQRQKAAEYLERNAYAGMRLEESSEQLDEVSKSTLKSYMKKASADIQSTAKNVGPKQSDYWNARARIERRQEGIKQAQRMLPVAKEEVEFELNDLLEYMLTADFEQLDEVSKNTLKSYMHKAGISFINAHDPQKYGKAGEGVSAQSDTKTISKRTKGISRALAKLTKEEFEQLDEISKGTLGSYIKKATSAGDERSISNFRKEEAELEEAVGDNHLHVQQVKHEGQTKYKVHAVGKNFADGIKVGEHLSDTELDDFSEMGGKIKHVKPAAAKPMKEARSLSAILDEARGRPSKKASEDEDEDDEGPDTGPEADQNIMVHLRKSTDTEGNHDVKFSDGSSHKVPAHVAHKVLGAMEKLKPADRAKIQSHIQQSHANLMAVHKMVS